jgi:hypothetical protein
MSFLAFIWRSIAPQLKLLNMRAEGHSGSHDIILLQGIFPTTEFGLNSLGNRRVDGEAKTESIGVQCSDKSLSLGEQGRETTPLDVHRLLFRPLLWPSFFLFK